MLGQQAVGVLVDAQLVQGGEVLAAEVAAVTQLFLVALDVLEEGLQLLESLSTGFHHTLVHLGEEGRVTGVAHHGNKQGKSSASSQTGLPFWKSLPLGHLQRGSTAPRPTVLEKS